MKTVLVVDDEKNIRETLKDVLEDEGFEVILSENGKSALEILGRNAVDVVLLDLWLPEVGWMDVLRITKEEFTDIQVIIISGHGSIDTAVKATKMGAFDFIEKPLSIERVLNVVDHAIKIIGLRKENVELKEKSGKAHFMVEGRSRAFREIERIMESTAAGISRNLITGENGTGKELVARRIHEKSARRAGPFVAVNCAAIPQTLIESELFGYEKGAFTGAYRQKPGKFEIANDGIIFLDEIGDISLSLQSKLLQVLQDHEFSRLGGRKDVRVNVRVLAATNRNLEKAVEEGRFREDLYYRLNVVNVTIPPLRERKEEIPFFIQYFLNKFEAKYQKRVKPVPGSLMDAFLSHDWLGNVRELGNLIQRFVVLQNEEEIMKELSSLPKESKEPEQREGEEGKSRKGSLREVHKTAVREAEKELICKALQRTNWNRKKAADLLNVSYKTLLNKIKESGIDRETASLSA